MLKQLFSFIFIFFHVFNASLLFIATSAVPQPAVNNYEPEGSQELERTGLNRREQPLSAGFPHACITSRLLIG